VVFDVDRGKTNWSINESQNWNINGRPIGRIHWYSTRIAMGGTMGVTMGATMGVTIGVTIGVTMV
jgi:hypothetical protein